MLIYRNIPGRLLLSRACFRLFRFSNLKQLIGLNTILLLEKKTIVIHNHITLQSKIRINKNPCKVKTGLTRKNVRFFQDDTDDTEPKNVQHQDRIWCYQGVDRHIKPRGVPK